MSKQAHGGGGCPLERAAIIDLYFMEHRAKLIDIAAFLDRIDRGGGDAGAADDFRMQAFHRAIRLLSDGQTRRSQRILELFSDSSQQPIDKAPMKGAVGAYQERG